MLVASEEATSGSVMANAERISPASKGFSQRLFLHFCAVAQDRLHVASVRGAAVEHFRREMRAAHDFA